MQENNEQDASFHSQLHSSASPSVTAYRMRCPNCRKLYSVEPYLILGIENPQFQCVACQTSFVAHERRSGTMLETIAIGEPAQAKTETSVRRALEPVPTLATRPCPKCGASNQVGTEECRSCGVVIARYRPGEEEKVRSEIEMTGRLELVQLWDEVASDYRNEDRHEAFVRACHEAGALPFAAQKYARVLAGAPGEEIARRMKNRVVALANSKFETSDVDEMRTRWNVPLPSFNSFILMLGVALVGIGVGLPHARDIAGLGTAMIALAVGLRIYTRRPVL